MSVSRNSKAPLWLWIAVAILLGSGIIFPQILAVIQTDYSTISNYLSELGAVGAPYASITNLFGFLPVALSSIIILSAIAARQVSTRRGYMGAALVLIGISTGYLIAVFFPCDLGCPVEGSGRQAIHNLAGLIQYPCGAFGLGLLGREIMRESRPFGWLLTLSGVAMGLGFVMMIVPEQAAFRGAWQRFGDYSAFLAISAALFVRPKTSKHEAHFSV